MMLVDQLSSEMHLPLPLLKIQLFVEISATLLGNENTINSTMKDAGANHLKLVVYL